MLLINVELKINVELTRLFPLSIGDCRPMYNVHLLMRLTMRKQSPLGFNG